MSALGSDQWCSSIDEVRRHKAILQGGQGWMQGTQVDKAALVHVHHDAWQARLRVNSEQHRRVHQV